MLEGEKRRAKRVSRSSGPAKATNAASLGKILTASFGQPGVPAVATYDETYILLVEAIQKEGGNSRRANAHAYIGLFKSTVEYIRIGGLPTLAQRDHIRTLLASATTLFRGDQDVESLIREVNAAL
jgi:hypothetical protein